MGRETWQMTENEFPEVLAMLRRDPVRNAWALQDLTRWPDGAKFYRIIGSDEGYLLVSSHPATRHCPAVILQGSPKAAAVLLDRYLPSAPLVIRETPADLLETVRRYLPDAKTYLEHRMEVLQGTFRPAHKGLSRQLMESDAETVAQFYDAPPQAAKGYTFWLRGAVVFGAFQEGRLVAIASSMVEIPEVWVLVSIQTHPDFRGRGFGTEVTSALTARALEETVCVSLTVKKDNAPAIRVYEKLGYERKEDRVWIDHGVDHAP